MTTLSPVTVSPAAFSTSSDAAPASLPVVVTAAVATAPAPVAKSKTGAKPSKPRKRVNTAEKRNQHNAIERARRETLNGKFLSLARLLPSLAASRRPSKSAIVNGSIDHLTFQRDQRLLACSLLRQLCAERDDLLNEVNGWRKANGQGLKDGRSAWTEQMEEITSVEKEIFGSFASMGADDGDDEEEGSIEVDQNSFGAAVNVANGLITPRSSTDLDAPFNQQQQALFTSAPVTNADMPRDAGVSSVPAVAPVPGPTVGLNGINWSSDFTLGLHGTGVGAALDNVQFGSLIDPAINGSSPLTNSIVTPPAMSELLYTHTPSPASSTSNNGGLPSDVSSVTAVPATSLPALAPAPWTAEQFASMQQLVQQAQQAQYQQAQQAARQHQQQQMPFNPITGNTFNAMFGEQLHSNALHQHHAQHPSQAQQSLGGMPMSMSVPAPSHADASIQALMASAFPQHGKVGSMGAVSMQDIQKAVRLGMGMAGNNNLNASASGMVNPWLGLGLVQQQQSSPVEGY